MSYPEQHEKEIAKQVQLQKIRRGTRESCSMKDHKKKRYLKLIWAWFIKIEEQAEKKTREKDTKPRIDSQRATLFGCEINVRYAKQHDREVFPRI